MNGQISPDQVNTAGHLTIGGCDSLSLAAKYGTPLIVYDVGQIRSQMRRFKQVFDTAKVKSAVCYASKAFAAVAMYDVAKAEHVHIDVVSAGEIYTAMSAGFPMKNASFHGNNKSFAELEMAIDYGVGTIMVDNFHELDLLSSVLKKKGAKVNVMLRITPGISAHTHEYDQTGQVDSKFGFDLQSGQADRALQIALKDPRMKVLGLHAHIGSQIFELNGFQMAAKKLVDVAAHWREKFSFTSSVINVGGGFGIRYVSEDHPLAPEKFVAAIIDSVKAEAREKDFPLPAIWIEPGRSIVGPAGYNLYTIGSRKDVPGMKPYVTVDGGMGDNIRPALYQAQYESVLAKDLFAKPVENVRIAGKYCESGDILEQSQDLAATKPGDLLVMLDTGAYGYSMASNYNRNPRPAVVFAENGHSQLVIQRETLADLVENDLPYTNQPTH